MSFTLERRIDQGATGGPAEAPGSGFLRVPPFPKAKVTAFRAVTGMERCSRDVVAEALKRERVGGNYWGRAPLSPPGTVVARTAIRQALDTKANALGDMLWWSEAGELNDGAGPNAGPVNSWDLLGNVSALLTDPGDPAVLIAALLGVPVHYPDRGGVLTPARLDISALIDRFLPNGTGYLCPFTGSAVSTLETIGLCGLWARQIRSNQGITGGFGFAFWKKANAGTMLWNGSEPFRFLDKPGEVEKGKSFAVWRTRTSPSVLSALQEQGTSQIEVEDGFLRSRGLGADCVPPLSIIVDRLGAYFDPSAPSELENLLQEGEFAPETISRAAALRSTIIESGLGKYEAGGGSVERLGGERRHVLVPGQVEDDRSILTGGAGLQSNLELLRRVRAREPDAFIIYKPHPDVLAGHRAGAAPVADALQFADAVVTDLSIATLLDMVDAVHVNTSLTGFEALLRGKAVTTHGVPFYAGWSLTTDLGPVPTRRTRKRSIDELVAAALIEYPRYLDPMTGLPCPAEIAVLRLTEDQPVPKDPIVELRRLQGRVVAWIRGHGA